MCEIYQDGRLMSYHDMCAPHRAQFYTKNDGLENKVNNYSQASSNYQSPKQNY